MGRVLLGGIVGGILMFVWGYVSHAKLMLAEKSFMEFDNESKLTDAVRSCAKEPGIYAFPWVDPETLSDEKVATAYDEKHKAGPVGILVRGPDGLPHMETMQLVWEFATNVAAALIAAVIVSAIGANRSAPSKVVIVTLLGAFAWLSQNASDWIWYRFPKDYEIALLVDAVAGWFIAGAGIVALVKSKVKVAPR